MNTANFSDEQIHQAASRFMVENRVSYSEALTAVTSSMQFSEQGEPPQSSGDDEDSDSRLNFEAMAYHLINRVSYAQALDHVAQARAERRAARNAAVQVNHSSKGDQELHQRAVSYAESHSVSYAEALDALAGSAQPGAVSAAANTLQAMSIEIFKAGTHIDTAGASRVFTVDDVKGMAQAYDPAMHEAPLTIGHPVDDMPAQGWVSGLTATDEGVLLMQTRKVAPTFAEDVKAGRYLKRSASFYPPNAPQNPKPGRWYLRHVAWLGAQPPAVKGLADVNFAAFDGALCFTD